MPSLPVNERAKIVGIWQNAWKQKYGKPFPNQSKTFFWRMANGPALPLFTACRSDMARVKECITYYFNHEAAMSAIEETWSLWSVLRITSSWWAYRKAHPNDPSLEQVVQTERADEGAEFEEIPGLSRKEIMQLGCE